MADRCRAGAGPSLWQTMTDFERAGCEAMALDYRDFLSKAKTEWETVDGVVKRAAETGFQPLADAEPGKRKLLAMHHHRTAALAVLGTETPEQFSIIVAHVDSPRLDLKPRPLCERRGAGLLATDVYGMLKKYQWFGMPLALHGRVAKADGRVVNLVLGESPDDSVLTIPDLLPHLDRSQGEQSVADAFPASRLNLLAGLTPSPNAATDGGPSERHAVAEGVLHLLAERWGIREEDLVSAEIAAVPAGPAREVGLDRSCIGGYGQDDRVCAYAALWALLSQQDPARTCIALFIDREETGNDGPGSARSRFFEAVAADLLTAADMPSNWRDLRRTLMYARAVSADVDAALDPDRAECHDPENAARLGHGPALVRYSGRAGKSGSSETRPEYLAWLRKVLQDNAIPWQVGSWGWAETGGASTAARFLANHGMDVAELGVPLLSMHSPFEIAAKPDIWATAQAYAAFYAAP